MSKPKLLITMGCSYTEGVGCYDLETMPKNIKINRDTFEKEHRKLYTKLYKLNRDRFHEFSWPNQLGKKLNYDMVLNLGLGGSSTSGQVKVFMEKYGDESFENYDVLLVWLLTDSARISFYSDGHVINLLPHQSDDGELERAYLNFIQDVRYDPFLEQIFYLRLMEKVCKLNNWKFHVFLSHLMGKDELQQNLDLNNLIHYDESIDLFPKDNHEMYTSPVCNHPNEKGYEHITNQIFKILIDKDKTLLNKNKVEKFKSIYDGDTSFKFQEIIKEFKEKNKKPFYKKLF